MSAYARIYGFRIYAHTEIKGREEDFTWIGQNNYMLNADYELLEEILINDQCPPKKRAPPTSGIIAVLRCSVPCV